jgi:hypothetical protein
MYGCFGLVHENSRIRFAHFKKRFETAEPALYNSFFCDPFVLVFGFFIF